MIDERKEYIVLIEEQAFETLSESFEDAAEQATSEWCDAGAQDINNPRTREATVALKGAIDIVKTFEVSEVFDVYFQATEI